MPAFEKIESGLKGLDDTLQNIRLGDNVVWQISQMEEYRFFVTPFVRQAISDGKNIIYIRFAEHEPLISEQDGLKIEKVDIDSGFEHFTVKVHEIIRREGLEAFYVFDCLSDLQTVWAADLMMGNFFRLTCPYLFELDTVAYFAIIRNKHSYETIARVRETTQLFLDVLGSGNEMFVHPIKVWNRYSQTMFLPHVFEDNEGTSLVPLTDGVSASRFYSILSRYGIGQSGQVLDNWDKFFLQAKMNLDAGIPESQEIKAKMCKMIMGNDKKLNELVMEYFKIDDLLGVKERMVGSGSIGGKAVGMLLARKIIENKRDDLVSIIEPHDSFYIGSDVFYTYLVQNGWWKLHISQMSDEGYFIIGKELNEKMKFGLFPEFVRNQFRRMLEYFGQTPIIVRSSSLLEDGFGNAFVGKYESVFCINTGSLQERLNEFESAVKKVYASSMDESALAYRSQRNLDKCDEQMAVLVQRVSGSMYEDIYMPCAAGVGYSYNSYAWTNDIDPKAGLVRIVLGLGTRAVDRTDGDYPRIAALDHPHLNPLKNSGDKFKFSQRYADVLDLKNQCHAKIEVEKLAAKTPKWFGELMYEHDHEVELRLRERGINREVILTTCSKLLDRKDIVSCLSQIMQTLQKSYNHPVDMEYTINISRNGDFVINILQCRPLKVKGMSKNVTIPQISREKIFFSVSGSTMGGPANLAIDYVVQVDPEKYHTADWNTKHSVARAIGRINGHFKKKGKTVMLTGPGRWGTSSAEQGVPVNFAEICNIQVLCEVSYECGGLMPELSFGSHFFQDLVETDIFYAAIFQNKDDCLYQPEVLKNHENICNNIIDDEVLSRIIGVYEVGLLLMSDVLRHKTVCFME